MPFLIKLVLPMLIDFLINLVMEALKAKVADTESKVDDHIFEVIHAEKDDLKELALRKSKETGIYKRLKG